MFLGNDDKLVIERAAEDGDRGENIINNALTGSSRQEGSNVQKVCSYICFDVLKTVC